MNPLRFSLSILAICTLVGCAQQVADPAEAQPEAEPAALAERPVFESELNAYRQAVSDSGIAIDVDRPWFGHRSRIERMEALWQRGALSDSDFALFLIAEYENLGLLVHSNTFQSLEDNPYRPSGSDEEYYDPGDNVLSLLGDLTLEGSYTAIEGLLLLGVDGMHAVSATGFLWMTMEKHPGLVTEVILTSPAIRVVTFEGEEYTTDRGFSSYRLNPTTSLGGTALDFAQGRAIYPTDYLPGTTADDLIAIVEKEIEANPNSPIVGFWQRQIEKIREDW